MAQIAASLPSFSRWLNTRLKRKARTEVLTDLERLFMAVTPEKKEAGMRHFNTRQNMGQRGKLRTLFCVQDQSSRAMRRNIENTCGP
jgi:hypothetical protein